MMANLFFTPLDPRHVKALETGLYSFRHLTPTSRRPVAEKVALTSCILLSSRVG